MWINELVFEHVDGGMSKGTVTEEKIFSQSAADIEDSDKQIELANFEMNLLTGTTFESFVTDERGTTIYLSWQGANEIEVFAMRFKSGGVEVYKIQPTEGEIEP